MISFISRATLRNIIKPLLNTYLPKWVWCLCCYRSLIINTCTTVRMDHRFTLVTINRQERCMKAVGESWNVCPLFLPEIMHCFSNTVSRRWRLERVMKLYPRPSATLSVRDEMNGDLPHRDTLLRLSNTRLLLVWKWTLHYVTQYFQKSQNQGILPVYQLPKVLAPKTGNVPFKSSNSSVTNDPAECFWVPTQFGPTGTTGN